MTPVEMILKYYEQSNGDVFVYYNYEGIDDSCIKISQVNDKLKFTFSDKQNDFSLPVDDIIVKLDQMCDTMIIKHNNNIIMIHSL